jgi:Protein of unknown function (DUF3617)
MRAPAIGLVFLLLARIVGAAQPAIRPGQYEYTIEMNLGGVPADAPNAVLDAAGFDKQKRLECLTADDLKGDLTQAFTREMEGSNCKMSDVKTTGNRMTFTTTCEEDGIRMVMTNEMTFDADAFTGVMKGKDNEGRVSTVKMTAKRVGDCR